MITYAFVALISLFAALLDWTDEKLNQLIASKVATTLFLFALLLAFQIAMSVSDWLVGSIEVMQ